jgi:3-oxoacyl-(acyl-carrier-protein) reductase
MTVSESVESKTNGNASLATKVALVTGASRGIGKAIALELARRGADVAINYRSAQVEAEHVADEIRAMGRRVTLDQGHVGSPKEARAIVQRVIEEYGRLDILVNNAGITRDHSVRKMTDEEWDEVIQVNLTGVWYVTSAAIPAMIEKKFGRIINVTSYGAEGGNFGQANYAASKGGIISFTRVLALELARYNITANCVAPGFTYTDMMAQIPQNVQEQIKGRIPLGRFGTPEDVAKAAAFLATDADYITGTTLDVNGGIYFG